ncbi:MAG: peroxiredoxin [Myxococcota bacterium]
MTINVGDKAPDFTLPRQDGKPVRLYDLLARGPVVLYFYPRDETSGCTAEACSFRDAYEDFQAAGAEVVGVSSDSEASHQSFAAHHRLPFVLLSDRDNRVRALYDVPRSLFGLVAGRVTYVIDPGGTVRHVFNSLVQATRHVDEALRTIRQMPPPRPSASP